MIHSYHRSSELESGSYGLEKACTRTGTGSPSLQVLEIDCGRYSGKERFGNSCAVMCLPFFCVCRGT